MLKQHICIFYLADKLTCEQLQRFFYRLSTVLDYDESTLISYFMLYSLQYPAFKEIPDESQLKAMRKFSPCDSCAKLCKKTMYKAYNIQENACRLCEFSELYQNARITDELHVLRYLMEPGIPFKSYFLSSLTAFSTCYRISEDYAVGTYPVIQVHAAIYDFLSEHVGEEYSNNPSFMDSFLLFLQSGTYGDGLSMVEPNLLRERISIIFNTIMNINFSSITTDLLSKYIFSLQDTYTYVPKKVPLKLVKEVKKHNNTKMPIVDDSQLSIVSIVEPKKKTDESIPYIIENAESDENSYCDTFRSCYSEFISIENKTDYPSIKLFSDSVSFDFTVLVTKSDIICILPSTYYGRIGVILYLSCDSSYYFYDLSLYGADSLQSLLSTKGKQIYTLTTLACMCFFARYDGMISNIIPIDLTYSYIHGDCSHATIVENLFTQKDSLSRMQFYPEVYNKMCATLNAHDLHQIRRRVVAYQELSYNWDMYPTTDIRMSFHEDTIMNVNYGKVTGNNLRAVGSLFTIGIPKGCSIASFQNDSFFEDTLLIMASLPHAYRQFTHLLFFGNDHIFLFYTGLEQDSDICYDLFMAALQRAYLKKYKEPLTSMSNCYIYEQR